MRINTFAVVIIIVSIAIVAILAYFTVWPWVMISLGLSILPNPPRPEIIYGEFPFRLVYEINGETKVIEDTLICEYDGIGMDTGRGKFLKWKVSLASGNHKILLLNIEGSSGIARLKKTLKQEIYYDPGPAWYYMGEHMGGNGYMHNFPNASFSEQYQDGIGANGILLEDDLFEKYKIKLISWDYAQPIKNTFSTTKR